MRRRRRPDRPPTLPPVARHPGRPTVPMVDKLHALSVYERSNMPIGEICALFGRGERTVRRWIADARNFLDELEQLQVDA